MAKELKIELVVDDKGTAVIKSFSDNATTNLKKVEAAGGGVSSSVEALRSHWLAFSAAAVAAGALINKGFAEMEKAAKGTTVRETFNRMAEDAGTSGATMLAELQKTTAGTVSSTDLMQRSVKAMIKEFSPDQIVQFGTMARTASRTTGASVQESFDMIVDAVGNKTPKALVDCGILTKEQSMVIQKAIKANVEDFDLFAIAAEGAKLAQARMGEQTVTDQERMEQFHVTVNALGKSMGTGLLNAMKDNWDAVGQLGEGFTAVAKGGVWLLGTTVRGVMDTLNLVAAAALAAGGGIVAFSQKTLTAGAYLADAAGMKETAALMRSGAASMEGTYQNLMAGASETTKKVTGKYEEQTVAAKTSNAEQVAASKASMNQMIDHLKGKVEAAKAAERAKNAAANEEAKAERNILASLTSENKERYEQAANDADNWLAIQKANGFNELNYALDVIDKKTDALDKWYDDQADAINKHTKLESEKQAKLQALDTEYSKNWDKLAGTRKIKAIEVAEFQKKAAQSYITWDRKQLADLADYERSNAGDRVSVCQDAWDKMYYYQQLTGEKTEETMSETLDMMIQDYEGTFVGGWKSGLVEMQQDLTRWGDVSKATFKAMSQGMADTFSNIFEDAYKGDLKSIGDYSTAIWDTMRKAFFKTVADMLTQEIIIYMATAWKDGGTSALGIVDKLLGLVGVESSLAKDALSYVDVDMAVPDFGGFSQGGTIPGNALFAGDHPGNDTVPIWASPGEVMIRRSSVNSETSAILDYINKFGRVPAYAYGGVVGTITNEPYKGYWGFSDFFEAVQSVVSAIAPWGSNVLGSPTARQIATSPITDAITKAIVMTGITYGVGQVASGIYSAGLAETAASEFAADVAAANSVVEATPEMLAAASYTESGAMIYGSPAFFEAAAEVGMTAGEAATLSGLSMESVVQWIKEKAISTALKNMMKGPGVGAAGYGGKAAGEGAIGSLDFSLSGDDNGSKSSLGSFFRSLQQSHAISARNGLDYVPRDNTLINAHEGEAVLTKQENRDRLSRGGVNLTINLTGTVIDRNAVNEFADMIYPRLKKLEAWGH